MRIPFWVAVIAIPTIFVAALFATAVILATWP